MLLLLLMMFSSFFIIPRYTGVTKRMKITRKVLKAQGLTPVDKIVEFEVKPGWKSGNRVTFRK